MLSSEHLHLLKETAKECGADTVRYILARDIIVEKRTVLKCIFGCSGYGSRVCPPHIPSVDEFKDMLGEYEDALIVEWPSQAEIPPDIGKNYTKYGISKDVHQDRKECRNAISRQILRERATMIQPGTLEIEKRAWELGYGMALATFPGKCAWCTTDNYNAVNCAGDNGPCRHPTRRRPCLMGLGIRLDKTLDNLGTPLAAFPLEGATKAYSIVLVD